MSQEQPQANVTSSRPPWWLVAVLVVVAIGAGFGAGALVWAGGGAEEQSNAQPSPYDSGFPVLTPEEYERCVRQVVLNFDGDNPDAEMREAAARLRVDARFESARARTRQESYEEFKKVFADDPELLGSVRPESLPASVLVMVRRGGTAKPAKEELGKEFPGTQITVQDWCPKPPR